MSVSDDSDENIFDASARPALARDDVNHLNLYAEDETSCELLQLASSQNGATCDVDSPMKLVVSTHHQATVRPTNVDSECECDLQDIHRQDATVSLSPQLAECESSVDIDSSVANTHCDAKGHTTDSLVTTDSTAKSNSCLMNMEAAEVLGSSQTVESADDRVRDNSDELDEELLAELENEVSYMTAAHSDSISSDCANANGPVSSQVDHLSNDDLTLAFLSLQRRQQALECRLQNTLEARKQLETDNARLEHKLSACQEALEAAKQDMDSAKLQV